MAPQSNVADLTKSVRGAAHQLVAWQWPAQVRDVRKPEPGPGEVLLRVGGAGLCRSDLHAMRWPAGALPYELPFTLGHEVSGTVATLGEGTDGIDAAEAEQGRSDVNSPLWVLSTTIHTTRSCAELSTSDFATEPSNAIERIGSQQARDHRDRDPALRPAGL
jgi:hypothetical protein